MNGVTARESAEGSGEHIDDEHDERIRERAHARANDATPTGLLQLGRGGLARVVALYTILVIAVLAIPALVVQPRGTSSHLTKQEVPTAPGRAR